MLHRKTTELENSIDRFFKVYSTKRVVQATVLLGIASIGAAWLVYALTTSALFSVLTFGLVGFVCVNVAVLVMIPPRDQIEESKQLLLGVVKDRKRIQSMEGDQVTLLDSSGKSHSLKGLELQAWKSILVPHFVKSGLDTSQIQAGSERKLTASERRYVEQEKKDILEREKSMAEEQKRIAREKARIEAERAELSRRDQELNQAEEVVINRLNEVETAQAELEQLREDLDAQAGTFDGAKHAANDKHLRERETALKSKEAELEALKQQLLEDQTTLRSQKTDLNQLKGELLQASASDVGQHDTPDPVNQEQLFEERLRKLEAETRKLEERSRYIEEVESSLVDRLHSLTEREALIEQNEVNSGIRSE